MKKILFAIVMAVTFTACADRDDNPVIPDNPQQPEELADYTIIYYGHGGGNLDVLLMQNIMDFSFAEEEAYKNVNICVQYKFSTLKDTRNWLNKLTRTIRKWSMNLKGTRRIIPLPRRQCASS